MERIKTRFKCPTRIIIVGQTTTGKSELVYKMITRNDFGFKPDIYIFAPSNITLNQGLWKRLREAGYNVKTELLNKKTKEPVYDEKNKKPKVIIFDDLDDAISIPNWVWQKFTIASHHMNETVICISHKLRIGKTQIRGSADWVILTANLRHLLEQTCKELGINNKTVYKELENPEGFVKVAPNQSRNFNHVVIRQCFDIPGEPRVYKLGEYSDVEPLIAVEESQN